ncbi:hypothetical protein M3148_16390 [Georgenia satyanarayanai]|uniref:hypothetical protein n=1 Tax=Georgenia satyanarayanai TaxID=860221 RepID=UPI00203E0582|nr:hypothetical protein [Georgenia satyanarayanai]MCM3662557.1 hypothetical protein [Georgenia satyanarayanai]
MAPASQPVINPKHIAITATVAGLVLAVAVLLWVFEIVPFGVFIAVLAVVVVSQAGVILVLARSGRERASRVDGPSGGTSTIGPDSPAAGYGYDPMGDIGRDGRR